MKTCLLLFMLPFLVYSQPLNFPQDTIAYNERFNNREFAAFDSQGKLHVSYTGQLGTNSSTREIYYVKEEINGTFSTINLTNNLVDDNYSTLSVDKNDKVHVGFLGRDASNLFQVKYTNNVNGSFFEPIYITTAGLNKATPYSRVGPDSVVHFVYFTYTNDPDNIYYINYDLRTSTLLASPVLLSDGETSGDFDAALTVDKGGFVHIVLKAGSAVGGQLKYFNNKTGSLQAITTGVTVNVTNPKVVVDESDVTHIVYRNETDKRLYYIHNSSGVFSTPLAITPTGQRPATYQNIDLDDNNNLFVVYQSSVTASGRGFYLVHGRGDTFSDTILVHEISTEYVLRNSTAVVARGNGEIAVFYAPSAMRNSEVVCDIFMKRGYLFGLPVINVSTDSIDFGEVPIGLVSTESFIISNSGSADLIVYPSSCPDTAFTVYLSDTLTIPPDSSKEITVVFSPTDTSFHYSELIINSNAVTFYPVIVKLTGKGSQTYTIQTDKDTLYFSWLNVWQDTLTIYNTSTSAVLIDSITTTLPEPYNQPPRFGTLPEPPFQINQGDSLILIVYFGIPVTENILFDFTDSLFIHSSSLTEPHLIILRWDEPPQGIKDDNIVDEFNLYQNYPNPFNPVTQIKFAVPQNFKQQASNHNSTAGVGVKLVVFDMLGREVAVLVNEEKEPGFYEVSFDANQYGLSSGVYFYRLQYSGASMTKKLILMR